MCKSKMDNIIWYSSFEPEWWGGLKINYHVVCRLAILVPSHRVESKYSLEKLQLQLCDKENQQSTIDNRLTSRCHIVSSKLQGTVISVWGGSSKLHVVPLQTTKSLFLLLIETDSAQSAQPAKLPHINSQLPIAAIDFLTSHPPFPPSASSPSSPSVHLHPRRALSSSPSNPSRSH